MGSLMAGWDSKIKDPKIIMLQRNKSHTREEIAAYWKSKNQAEDGDHSADSSPRSENQENMHKGMVQMMQRSNTMPLTDRRERNESKMEDDEKSSKKNGWWTRSNWAFLNEPPVIATDGHQKYTPQFNVAKLSNSKLTT